MNVEVVKNTSSKHSMFIGNGAKKWQNIIWREWYYCQDKEYAAHLHQAVGRGISKWLCHFMLLHQSRPYVSEVEAALRTACMVRPEARQAWEKRLQYLDEVRNKSIPLDKLITNLQAENWFTRFIACHVLLYLGGTAIEALRDLAADGPVEIFSRSMWLLRSIGAETAARLGPKADVLLCPDCLVYCSLNCVFVFPPDRIPIKYFGCPRCGQSLRFNLWPNPIIAVLDQGMTAKKMEQTGQIRVNWLQYRQRFDFNRVEIIQATDEEVERFVVQAGNETDPRRRPRYKRMQCVIGPECRLSENTVRILQHTFGRVGYKERLVQ